MINSVNWVPVREIDGKASGIGKSWPEITVQSHSTCSGDVVLVIDSKSYTVREADLSAAAKNATNTARY